MANALQGAGAKKIPVLTWRSIGAPYREAKGRGKATAVPGALIIRSEGVL